MKSIGFSEFRPFQTKSLKAAHSSLIAAMESKQPTLVVLESPTASGKTVITAGLLEQFMAEVDSRGRPATVLWLSYSPALNDQSKRRLQELTDLACVSLTTDAPVTSLDRGYVYFLNVGLLGKASASENKDTAKKAARASLRKALLKAFCDNGENLLVVIDEAHRGADSKDADLSLMQLLLEAPENLPDIDPSTLGFEVARPQLVLAISATPTKLLNRYTSKEVALFDVQQTPPISMLEVADQGLLKRVLAIERGNFKSATTSALAAFRAACKKRDELEEKWQAIGKRNSRTAIIPLLLVQLPNRDAEGEFEATEKELMSEAVALYGAGAAHVIQDEKGLAPRFVDAGTARLDPTLKVVFYQSALDEGWDCPRAQLLLSLRTQLEKDRITQIIGRILRMPDATHTGDLDCDTAYLWAPLFDSGSAESVKAKLEEGFKRPDGSPGQFVQLNHATLQISAEGAAVSHITLPAEATISTPLTPYAALAELLVILDEDPATEALGEQLKRDALQALLSPDFMGDLSRGTDMAAGWTRSSSALVSTTPDLQAALKQTPVVAPLVVYEASPDAVLALRPKLTNSELGPVLGHLLAHLTFRLESVDDQPLVGALYRLYVGLEKKADAMRAALRSCLLAVAQHTGLPDEAVTVLQRCLFDKVALQWRLPASVRYQRPQEGSPENKVATIPKDAMCHDVEAEFQHLFRSSWEKMALGRVVGDTVIAVFRNPESHEQGGFSIVYRNSEKRLANYFPDFLVFRQEESGVVVDFVEPKGGDPEGLNKQAALDAYMLAHQAEGWVGRKYWGDPKTW